VITFDDSTLNQVKFTPQGKLAPDCALAHWMAFAEKHPDFPMRGVFFVNSGYRDSLTFEQKEFAAQKLKLIVDLGGEIGNHTWTHANLRKESARAPAEIGRGEYEIERMLPGYQVHSFALPHGIYPVPKELSWHGEWRNRDSGQPKDVRWDYEAVVKVGANPAPSPLVAGFNGRHLPRIQAFDPELDKWLTYFERHPERRFISDGQRHAPGSLPPVRSHAHARI
jgi:peptidoglycan/xylan/chitin deacetylase (PgdA/CDA1 family)